MAKCAHGNGQCPPDQRLEARNGDGEDYAMRQSALICAFAIGLSAVPVAAAFAGSNYDGTWSLVFVTQRGECDPSYSFNVNIANGIVSHPNLVRFTGRVGANGLVHASVTVQDKYAAGSGKLTKTAGQGTWKGRSGTARCSGYWTAQKS
jgi:hypothetical protein